MLTGFRVLSLPNPTLTDPEDDPDYLQSANDVDCRIKHLMRTSEKVLEVLKEYLLDSRVH